MSNFPPIDKPFIDRVFAALSVMEIQLDQDPLQYGPKRLSGKIATTRGMLTQCERIYLQVAHMLQEYRAANRASQLEFDLGLQHLLANDPEVRAGRNVKDRDAIATMKLCDVHKVLSDLGTAVLDLEAVMAVTKAKRTDLKDVQSRLRDQMKLCSEEIGLGARWGSRPAPGQASPDLDSAPQVDVTTVDELRDLFQGSAAELQAPEPEEESTENEIDTMLSNVLGNLGNEEQALLEAETPEKFTEVSLKQLERLTEEEKKAEDIDHWAKTLNEQGPGNKSPIPINEALPPTDSPASVVDDFLQAIDPTMPQPKMASEISIDDLLGDL